MEDWPRAATAEAISRERAKGFMAEVLLMRGRETLYALGAGRCEGIKGWMGYGGLRDFRGGWKILHPEATWGAYRQV
jgi:hypothetical protein